MLPMIPKRLTIICESTVTLRLRSLQVQATEMSSACATGFAANAQVVAPNNGNPCASAGNAPDPNYYANKGQAASSNVIKDIYNLFNFRRGGALDAQVGPGSNGQPFGGSPAYANYTFGVYM